MEHNVNALLFLYRQFDSPKVSYITLNREDLSGTCTVREFIAAQHDYPADSITILDILPQ